MIHDYLILCLLINVRPGGKKNGVQAQMRYSRFNDIARNALTRRDHRLYNQSLSLSVASWNLLSLVTFKSCQNASLAKINNRRTMRIDISLHTIDLHSPRARYCRLCQTYHPGESSIAPSPPSLNWFLVVPWKQSHNKIIRDGEASFAMTHLRRHYAFFSSWGTFDGITYFDIILSRNGEELFDKFWSPNQDQLWGCPRHEYTTSCANK